MSTRRQTKDAVGNAAATSQPARKVRRKPAKPASSAATPATRAPAPESDAEALYQKPAWLCFSDLRNHMKDEPVLDFLHVYGPKLKYQAKPAHPADFSTFIMSQGVKFEDWVVRSVVRPLFEDAEFCDLSRFNRWQHSPHLKHSLDALYSSEVQVIYQPFLACDTLRWYGHPDLLVRNSALGKLYRRLNEVCGREEEADALLPDTGGDAQRWTVIDTKYSSRLAGKPLYQGQTYMYMRMLNSMMPADQQSEHHDLYLLGRTGELVQAFTSNRQVLSTKDALFAASDWIKRLYNKTESKQWVLEPQPSVAELRVNAQRDEGSVWDEVCNRLAEVQGDITMVYKVGPAQRSKLGFPTKPWHDQTCTARYLLGAKASADVVEWVDEMLDMARRARAGESDLPIRRLSWSDVTRGATRAVDMQLVFVDFEFAYDLHLCQQFRQDGAAAQSWTFAIASVFSSGSGAVDKDVWTDCIRSAGGDLNDAGEDALWKRWLEHLRGAQSGSSTMYLVHWSPAETRCLAAWRKKADARTDKNVDAGLSELLLWLDRCCVWVDVMAGMIASRLVVPGCMEYGLKAMYKHMPASTHERTCLTATEDTITADRAAALAYILSMEKKLGEEVDPQMQAVMRYNADDVLMMRAVWETVVEL